MTPIPSFEALVSLPPGDFTFGVIKPGVEVIGILNLIASTGYEVWPLTMEMDAFDVRLLYYEHVGKDFYPRNAAYIQSGPSTIMLIVGPAAQKVWREELMPKIRKAGEVSLTNPAMNLVHGADSPMAAMREVALFFFRSDNE